MVIFSKSVEMSLFAQPERYLCYIVKTSCVVNRSHSSGVRTGLLTVATFFDTIRLFAFGAMGTVGPLNPPKCLGIGRRVGKY